MIENANPSRAAKGYCTMPELGCEPWDNGHVLASMSRELVGKLAGGPLTDEQVVRSCVLENELVDIVDPVTRRKIQTGMLRILVRVILTFGKRPAPEKTVRKVEEIAEKARAGLNWKAVPKGLRDLAERRARSVTEHCSSRGWISRTEYPKGWVRTGQGIRALKDGTFNFR